VERGGRVEGGGGMESGGRMEGLPGLREGGTGSGSSGRTAAVTHNGAFRPQTHHPGSCQHHSYSIWFINSVKGKRKVMEEDQSASQYVS
jgi:hypothetical protein